MVTSPGHGHSPRAPHPLSRESPAVLSAIAADAMLIGVRGLYELTRFEANCFDEPGSEKPCLRSADPAFRAHPILAGPPRRFCGSSSWPYPPATWPTRPTGAESPGQLNRGENPHALRRNLAYAGEGAVRRRHHEQQTEQMWCLTLATNAIVCRSTEYHGLGVAALRRDGRPVHDEILAHIWPTYHENVHFHGTHSVDIAGELAKLDADGYRQLRLTTDAFAGQSRDVSGSG